MEYFNGDIVFTGHTNSDNFPVTQNCYDDTYNGYTDIFISRFNISNNSTIYSTFIGGPQSEVAKSLGIDDEGFIYLTGTCEENFPITNGSYDTTHNGENDAFVLKMDGNLSNLVFSTYIGGYSDDYGRCIKLDSDKNIVISGKTRSMNFPIVGNPAANKGDIFVLKLNNSGSKLLMSRYIHNSKNTQISGMVKNENGDFYIFGRTVSTDLETTESAIQNTNSGQWDGFLIMMDSDLNSTIYSTYYGGIDDDIIEDIYLLDNRELLMVGTTESINLPLTDNAIRRYLSVL